MPRIEVTQRSALSSPSAAIADTLVQATALSDRAILVGNRAGVVEWANPAWTRITGFPLAETISKPITDFLEETSIELDLVDFIGQNFLDGRSSTLEFPFETFDGRSIWVRLEVQPVRNPEGEISEFVATASDITERRREDLSKAAAKRELNEVNEVDRGPTPNRLTDMARTSQGTLLSLSEETRIICEEFMRRAGSRTHVDVDLDPKLPSCRADHLLLSEIIRLMMNAAMFETDESWGVVTVMTGLTTGSRSHISAAHPIPLRDEMLENARLLFLEVHDTAPTLDPAMLEIIRTGRRSDDPRVHALAMAAALAKAVGGHILVDSMPGCGTQAILLLPIPSARSSRGTSES